LNNITDVSAFTSPVTVLADGDAVDAAHSVPTAQALANRTRYLSDNLLGVTSVVGASLTTTLLATSTNKQVLTGTQSQIFVLPDETTLILGRVFEFFNMSTGNLTVKDSGGATLFVIHPPVGTNRAGYALVVSTSAAAANGGWRYFYDVPGQVLGTNTNDAASGGNVGELVTGQQLFASRGNVTTTPGTAATNVLAAPLALTAGDWQVAGGAFLAEVSGSGTDDVYVMVSKVSAVTPTGYASSLLGVPSAGEISIKAEPKTAFVGQTFYVPVPSFPVSLSAPASLYLTAKNDVGNATWSTWGYLNARRIR
jgi:hypothetical protein